MANPFLATSFLTFSILVVTITAFLFSLYLTFIQVFALKQLCTWCLISAGISIIILISAFFVSDFSFISLLGDYHGLILAGHLFGMALGLGSVTIADIFFFKFLKDFRISEWEADILHTLSQVIWFGLAVLVLTGIGLYLPEAERLNQSAKFLVKMIVFAVIVANGLFLNLLVQPRLVKISLGGKHRHETGELRSTRRVAFALGAISIVSWYSAFVLGMFRASPMGFLPLLLLYVFIIVAAVVGSQIMERLFSLRDN